MQFLIMEAFLLHITDFLKRLCGRNKNNFMLQSMRKVPKACERLNSGECVFVYSLIYFVIDLKYIYTNTHVLYP